jgi:hypothetical protein
MNRSKKPSDTNVPPSWIEASIFENSTKTASLAMQYWLSRAFRRQAVAILGCLQEKYRSANIVRK